MATQTTYWGYLKLDSLLSLQSGTQPVEAGNVPNTDELHFIVVHQTFELWFKLILAELRLARDKMSASCVEEETIPFVVHHLNRVTEIFRAILHNWGVMETLAPQDFLEFRTGLGSASGFQSFQMREIEILLGLDADQRVAGHRDPTQVMRESAARDPKSSYIIERLDSVSNETTFRSALHSWLHRTPILSSTPSNMIDNQVLDEFIAQYLKAGEEAAEKHLELLRKETEDQYVEQIKARYEAASKASREFLEASDVDESDRNRVKRIRSALLFIESYRELPLLAWPRLLLDKVAELEEQFVLFRTHHARMVERIIGRRVGSGGSSGVDYLDATTRYRIFPELWAVRTVILQKSHVPPVPNPQDYGFALSSKFQK